MALVNPNIAMSFRGVEVPQQNALADYAAIQQIQSGQRQAEVSQMQLESMRRDQAALSKMQAAITAKGGPADLNVAADEMIKSGIPEYLKQGLVIKQALDKQSRFASLLGPSGGAAPAAAPPSEAYPGYNESIGMRAPTNALAPASEAYPGYNEAIGMTNALAPAPAAAPSNAMNLSDMRNRIDQAYSIGTPEALAWAKAREEELKPMTVSPGATVFQGGQSVFTAPATPAAPAAPPSMVAEYNFAKTKDGGSFKGTFQQFVTARAAAGRAPAQPPAPTITTIVNPVNPNEMLTIDARRYQQGGGAGSPGVIGVAGKEPSAALRTNKAEAGKTQLADDLENLRESFRNLDKMRAIPSTERNVVSNLMSATAASGAGQVLGRAGGTEAQVERDVINSARMRLVNSIKNATGMSAQQLNSNVELQTMLKSISDPGQSVQAALQIIDDIDDAYVKGDGKMLKRKPAGAGAANVVVTPDGQSHTFTTPAAAAAFKKAAGL
jgi:hypothetical protein